jgi:SAM-dependent methyltransferase
VITMTRYVLDNASEQTGQRFTSLETCFDPVSIRQLEHVGVSEGWSCLEVGGGGGSIARWMSNRVGPAGNVLVTDINPRWLDARSSNIELRRHDITCDPLPEQAFDLVHARLVLLHLPERDQVLQRLLRSLKPGGWLLIEDFDCTWLPFAPACSPAKAALFDKVLGSFHRLLEDGGADLAQGRFFHAALIKEGLVDVRVQAHAEIWAGGSIGCQLHRANIEQLRDRLVDSKLVTDREIADFYELIEDPTFSVNSYLLVSGCGRRLLPGEPPASQGPN